jgi:ketosteroid isomerase-like protein
MPYVRCEPAHTVVEVIAMSEGANREFIRTIYEAAAAGDVGPLFAAMGPDFVAYEADSLPWGGEHRGLEANQLLVEKLAQYLDFSTLAMHHYLVDADMVIALGSVVWRGLHGDESVKMPLAEAWQVRDGKAVSLRPFFYDTATMLASKAAATS